MSPQISLLGGSPAGLGFAGVIAVAFQVAVQTGAAEAVPLTHLKHRLNMHLADFLERKRSPVIALLGTRPTVLQMLRQIPQVHEVARRCNARTRDDIF
jgi:hypothetical protein